MLDRFAAKVHEDNHGCWIWTGKINVQGVLRHPLQESSRAAESGLTP